MASPNADSCNLHAPAIILLALFAFPARNIFGNAGWDVSRAWLVPMVLYIVPFIVLFRRWPLVPLKTTPHNLFVYVQPTALLVLGMAAFGNWGLTTGGLSRCIWRRFSHASWSVTASWPRTARRSGTLPSFTCGCLSEAY